jgi:hypothetical protein
MFSLCRIYVETCGSIEDSKDNKAGGSLSMIQKRFTFSIQQERSREAALIYADSLRSPVTSGFSLVLPNASAGDLSFREPQILAKNHHLRSRELCPPLLTSKKASLLSTSLLPTKCI